MVVLVGRQVCEDWPNIGLWWYYMLQIHTRYRGFFVVIFNSILPAFAIPLMARFRQAR